jgi:lipoprotein-anchoring transpeptidase ErfK/SrfK
MARRYGRNRYGSLRYILPAAVILTVVAVLWLRNTNDTNANADHGNDQNQQLPNTSLANNNDTNPNNNLTSQAPEKTQQKKPPVKDDKEKIDTPKVQLKISAEAQNAFTQGKKAFDSQQYLQAARFFSDAVRLGLTPEMEEQTRKMLNEASNYWLLARNIYEDDPFCLNHKVTGGELLVQIQKKYNIPYEFIMRINNIKDARSIGAGATLKVVRGPFNVVVDRKRFLMSVYLGDMLVRSYKVGLGKPGRDTPTGEWLVELKQPNPAWTDPDTHKRYEPDDPENPLGERWIRLKGIKGAAEGRKGFGIHGTIKPEEIGHAASRGCIRLYNGDVRELYDMLVPGQSHVYVIN